MATSWPTSALATRARCSATRLPRGARHPPAGRARPHLHAALARRQRRRRTFGRALRSSVLADRHHRQRRQSLRLRAARAVTGRPKILVFNGCYHGAVDETFVRLEPWPADKQERSGWRVPRPDGGNARRRVQRTVAALERELAHGDVACVITEPVLTNCCMVLPEPGFHEALRPPDAPARHAAADRRDAHHLHRPEAIRAATASSPTSSCSASRSPEACRPASGA